MATIFFGKSVATGKEVHIPIEELGKSSTHILGKSQTGKSRELEQICRSLIKADSPLIMLDGKGDLYKGLLDYCALIKYPPHKLVLINPEDEYRVGLNFLECLGGTSPATQAGIILDCLKKFYGEQGEYQPVIEEWGPAGLDPLCRAGFALTELFDFMLTADTSFRDAVLQHPTVRPKLVKKWQDFDESYKKRPDQKEAILSAPRRRGDTFNFHPFLTSIFGQLKTTIDWRRIMDEGGVVLCNLHVGTGESEKALRFTGAAILQQLFRVGMGRPAREDNRRAFVVCDEFQSFLTPDVADALDKLNGKQVSFILAHQHLTQLKEKEPIIYASVMTNCRNKIVFNTSHEDALLMVPEVFPGRIAARMKEVKDHVDTISLRPIIEWIGSSSSSESSGDGSMDASQHARGFSSMESTAIPDAFGAPTIRSRGGGFQDGSSDMHASSSNVQRGETVTSPVPMVTGYEEFEQTTSRTFYGEPEAREELVAEINTQPDRHYLLKMGDSRPAIAMKSPVVQNLDVWKGDVAALKQKVYNHCARLQDDVLEEVDQRVPSFLEDLKHTNQKPDGNEPVKLRSLKPPPRPIPPRP